MGKDYVTTKDTIVLVGPIDVLREDTTLGGEPCLGMTALALSRVGAVATTGDDGKIHLQFPRTNLSSVDVEADWKEKGKREVFISLSYSGVPGFEKDIYLFTIVIPKGKGVSWYMGSIEA